mgnify:CR=1 FL=1
MKRKTRKGGFIKTSLTEDTKVYKVIGVLKEVFDKHRYDTTVVSDDVIWFTKVKGFENAKQLADERASLNKEIKCFVITDDVNRSVYRTEE